MRIQVKGRNVQVSDEVREHVEKRFRKIAKQVSELAELEVELFEERNPAISQRQVAEATLHLKGVTLRARDASGDLVHSINLCADELSVQVKRHRDKRRKRRESRVAASGILPGTVGSANSEFPPADLSLAGGEVVSEDVSPAA
jgi:putative sigma-54 modulation protein